MIQVARNIWVGTSDDGLTAEEFGVDAVLNVAQDLNGIGTFPDVEYAHVGLIDGPGNPACAYSAAVLMLHTLLERKYEKVLVYCHDGGRSLTVAIIYLVLKRGRTSDANPTLNCWATWDKMIGEMRTKYGADLPEPHEAHKTAFDKLPLSILEQLV